MDGLRIQICKFVSIGELWVDVIVTIKKRTEFFTFLIFIILSYKNALLEHLIKHSAQYLSII